MSKTIMIIGAGPGIGQATAQRFAAEGFRVILAARNPQRLEAQAQALRDSGTHVETVSIDASDVPAVAALVSRYAEQLDVLHYNAGVLHYDGAGNVQMRPLSVESVDSLVSDLHINIGSALAAIRAVMSQMTAKGSGTLLLTGGGLATHPFADLLSLSIGKAGLRATAQALFQPLKAQGVHIATVTVGTSVAPDSPQARAVAEAFWALHAQPADQWTWETFYG
jgi:short-subunit dehydrogenase